MYQQQLKEAKDRLVELSTITGDISPAELEELHLLKEKVAQLEVLGETTAEIARSFSFKLNVGNYESRDFFCSQKAECKLKDSERISEALHEFCKVQVMKDVNAYRAELEREKNAGARKKDIKDITKAEAQLDAGNIPTGN
jgi:hypothetical protein